MSREDVVTKEVERERKGRRGEERKDHDYQYKQSDVRVTDVLI